MLLAIDFDEDFIDVEGIAVASVLSLQSSGVHSSEFYAPQTNRFSTDHDASLSENIFDIAMTQIEAIVQPDSVTDDVGWESVALVCIHHRIIPFPAFNLSVPTADLHNPHNFHKKPAEAGFHC
jgi:hypothetical protein